MSTQRDELILKLQKQIEEKKALLQKPPRTDNQTSCSFKYNDDSKPLNLNVLNEDQIVDITGFLLQKEDYHIEAQQHLEITSKLLLHQGFFIGQWLNDLKNRIDKINYTAEVNKLTVLEKQLANLESDDLKKDKELDAIMKQLGM